MKMHKKAKIIIKKKTISLSNNLLLFVATLLQCNLCAIEKLKKNYWKLNEKQFLK